MGETWVSQGTIRLTREDKILKGNKTYPESIGKLNSPDFQRGKEQSLRLRAGRACRGALKRRVEWYTWGTFIDDCRERHGRRGMSEKVSQGIL